MSCSRCVLPCLAPAFSAKEHQGQQPRFAISLPNRTMFPKGTGWGHLAVGCVAPWSPLLAVLKTASPSYRHDYSVPVSFLSPKLEVKQLSPPGAFICIAASLSGSLSSHSGSLSSSSFCSSVRSLMYFPERRRGKGGRGGRGGPDTRVSKDCGAGSRQPAASSVEPQSLRQSLLLRLCKRVHPPAAAWTTAAQPWDYKQE